MNDESGIVRIVSQRGVVRTGRRVELYRQEDMQFRNGEVMFAGTLLLPRGEGPHPAVVFSHGSGRTTRDALRAHADYFARHGVAALI